MPSHEIVKIEISQHYFFNNDYHHDTFILDFENCRAYWDPKYFKDAKFFDDLLKEYGVNPQKRNQHRLFEVLDNRVTHDEYGLGDINGFLQKMESIAILNQLEPPEATGSLLNHVDFLNVVYITVHYSDCKEDYVVKWRFPDSWRQFSELLENLVGFDVLNISNSKYFISNLDYDILNDWIVDKNTGDNLILEKINFDYRTHKIGDYHHFNIDFQAKTLTFNEGYFNESVDELSGDVLAQIKSLIRQYHVFSWSSKESWSNLPDGCWAICDGYSWRLEFEFGNGAIFNIGGSNVNPDEYLEFAIRIKELFNGDLLRSSECSKWEA